MRISWPLVFAAFAVCQAARAQFDALPTINVTGSGLVNTDTNYVPNVVFCENGLASFEALKAQAVAARTFAYYKMDLQGFINDGTGDQVYSCNGSAAAIHFAAAAATEGEILYIRDTIGPAIGDVLIASFYVAGAIPSGPFNPNDPSAIPNPGDADPTNTQQWVTYPYENGLSGGNNPGTPLGFIGTPTNPNWPNRGAKSQNGADFLSDNSISYIDILKYYYGADIQLRSARTPGTGVDYGVKVLTNFDDYGERFGTNKEGHEGYFHRAPDFSGSTTENAAGSTANRTSSEAHQGTDSQLLDINYDEASGREFLIRHLSGARFSDFGGNSNVATEEANLQIESRGSVGFWLKTDDPGLEVSLAIDDPITGDRGVFQSVAADNQWHRYEWFLEVDAQWEAWVGDGNGEIDGDLVTFDSIQIRGTSDAEVYLDTIFWDPQATSIQGDFNNDGSFNCVDVDMLSTAIAAGSLDAAFDLSRDGQVNANDLTEWLTIAGMITLPSQSSYLQADANLDGVVDGGDFLIWNTHKFTANSAFCSGDFNADGDVNGADFLIWNNLKFQSSDAMTVPEPLPGCLIWISALGFTLRRGGSRFGL